MAAAWQQLVLRPPIRLAALRVVRPSRPVSLGHGRVRSFGPDRLTREEYSEMEDTIEELTADGTWKPPADFDDPSCAKIRTNQSSEPCGWARCRFTLIGSFSPARGGTFSLNHPGKDIDELRETCALRFAIRKRTEARPDGNQGARGAAAVATLKEIGEALGVSAQRVSQTLKSIERRIAGAKL